MFCEKCGTPVNEGDIFCPNCGAPVGTTKAAEAAPVNPALNPTPVMIWGIIALALCEMPIVGIIIAAIARKKVKAYYAAGGALCTQSKLGSVFSKIALPFSIIFTILFPVYIGIIIAGGILEAIASEAAMLIL